MSFVVAVLVFWVGMALAGVVYNVRRRNRLRCANMVCSQVSRDREAVTIPTMVEGITLEARLCPECWVLYRRWAVEG